MTIITTPISTGTASKPFAWSYSRLKNFESCPFKSFNVDLAPKGQRVVEQKNKALLDGDRIHKVMANALKNGLPVPKDLQDQCQPWVDKVRAGKGELLVEADLAITAAFTPTTWFGSDAWLRVKVDCVRISESRVAAIALDWKTGQNIVEDSVQLALVAQVLFSHHPSLEKIWTKFVWMAHGCTSDDVFTREDLVPFWPIMLDRVRAMEDAHNTQTYVKRPSGLCMRHCPVKACEYHGRGTR